MAHHQVAVALAALLVVGCMGGPPADLSTTRELALDDDVYLTREYRQSLAQFDRVLIEPVTLNVDPDARLFEQDEAEMLALARHFYSELHRQLGARYEIVDRPGRGVVRVRAAVLDADPRDRSMNLRPWSGPLGLWGGGATLRVDFSNSLTHQHIATAVADGRGEQHQERSGQNGWTHETDVLSYWAQLVRETMDTEHGIYGL